jgi:selenocysteine-specific elongation factor
MTGIDADRLIEEKERGMTLDLGFANITLPSGISCGIVDVPGHERYLKNMLAGVGGFDFALLIIDANEGVKAQTREHLEILQLLAIKSGLVVITKIDKASEERLDEVENEIKLFLKDTFLEKSPVIRVSNVTGEGINELISELDKRIKTLKPHDEDAPFRMPIDRVFTMTGFGTVVTGTVYQGSTETDRNIEILPSGRKGKIRQIQVHGKNSDEAKAGQRVALNIARISPSEIRRGDQAVQPGIFKSTNNIDVKVEVLISAQKPLTNRSDVRVYIGTDEVFGRMILLEKDELQPGESGYAQIVLKNHVLTLEGDRFIIRSPSALFTWGGGIILEPHPTFHRRKDKQALEMLIIKEQGDPKILIDKIMNKEPYSLFNQDNLAAAISQTVSKTGEILREMDREGAIYLSSSGRFILSKTMNYLTDKVLEILDKLQNLNPTTLGRQPEEIKRNLPKMEDRLFREILMNLKNKNFIKERKGLISTSDFTPKLTQEQERVYRWVKNQFDKPGFTPPSKTDLLQNTQYNKQTMSEVIEYMIFANELLSIDDNILFKPEKVEQAKIMIGEYILNNGGITPAQAREILDTTRKYVIPLLEYFDSIYFTRRKDSTRILFRENVLKR